MLPLALGSQDSCRIGGNLATSASGLNVVRYGMAREVVLGIEAVLADGTLLDDLHPLQKNNTGYDVKQLLTGTEGTLGIITAVSLKLRRAPRQTVTAFLAIDDPSSLAAILDRAYGIGRTKLDLLERHGDPGKVGLMRQIKLAMDPAGIMNPGKVVRVG